jgi:hypothetical protein
MRTRGPFPGGKAAGGVKLTTHLHLVPRSKNALSYTSTPQYAFMAWCSVKTTGTILPFYTLGIIIIIIISSSSSSSSSIYFIEIIGFSVNTL